MSFDSALGNETQKVTQKVKKKSNLYQVVHSSAIYNSKKKNWKQPKLLTIG